MAHTKKVFCGECQHYTSGFSDRDYEYCLVENLANLTRFVSTYRTRRLPVETR